MDPDKVKTEILREDDYFLDIKYGETPTEHYFKARSRQINFSAHDLKVWRRHQWSAWPATRSPLSESGEGSCSVILGSASIHSWQGIRLMHELSPAAHDISVQFITPSDARRRSAEEWAKNNDKPPPASGYAEITYCYDEESTSEPERHIWLLECWLNEPVLEELRTAIVRRELISLEFSITGENIYVDDGWDPEPSSTRWTIRSDRPDSGYSRCALVYLNFEVRGHDEFSVKLDSGAADISSDNDVETNKTFESHLSDALNVMSASIKSVSSEISSIGLQSKRAILFLCFFLMCDILAHFIWHSK